MRDLLQLWIPYIQLSDIAASLTVHKNGGAGRLDRLKKVIIAGRVLAAKTQLRKKIGREGWSQGISALNGLILLLMLPKNGVMELPGSHCSVGLRSHLAQVSARFNTRLIFMYVSSYFTMVPPCLVSCTSIFFLVGPAWAYCPARPLSPPFLILHLSSLFSFLSFGFSLSLRAWLVSFVGFSLCFIPTFSLLGPAWAYCPARPSSLPSSCYLFLFLLYFSLLSALPPSSFPLYRCLPKAASPNVATPYDPKWSLAAMSCAYLRWCATFCRRFPIRRLCLGKLRRSNLQSLYGLKLLANSIAALTFWLALLAIMHANILRMLLSTCPPFPPSPSPSLLLSPPCSPLSLTPLPVPRLSILPLPKFLHYPYRFSRSSSVTSSKLLLLFVTFALLVTYGRVPCSLYLSFIAPPLLMRMVVSIAPPSGSSTWSSTGPRWHGRSFFHLHP